MGLPRSKMPDESPSRSSLRATAPEFIPSAGELHRLFLEANVVIYADTFLAVQPSTLVQLHGILHGTSYEHKVDSVPPIGLIGNARSKPHPITVRSEDNLDDLHVSSAALCASFGKLQKGQVTKNEILCRCNGLRRWVPAEGLEDHVCQNTFGPPGWPMTLESANDGYSAPIGNDLSFGGLGQGFLPHNHTGNYVASGRNGPNFRTSREGFGSNGAREDYSAPSGRGRGTQHSPSKRTHHRQPRY